MKKIIILISIILILAACCPRPTIIRNETTKADSTLITISRDSLKLITQPRLEYRTDTVFITSPFSAIVDTVVLKDTIKIKYRFPENELTADIRRSPDSVYKVTVTKHVTDTVYVGGASEYAWWELLLLSIALVVIGYVAGVIFRRK